MAEHARALPPREHQGRHRRTTAAPPQPSRFPNSTGSSPRSWACTTAWVAPSCTCTPRPVILIRDSGGRWHATRTRGRSGMNEEIAMRLEVVPPLSRATAWIEVPAAGQPAEAPHHGAAPLGVTFMRAIRRPPAAPARPRCSADTAHKTHSDLRAYLATPQASGHMIAAARRGFPVREPAHPARPTVLSPTASRHLTGRHTPGSPGALPRRGPLRTVRATRRGTRLKQAARALQVEARACCAGGH